MVRSSRAKILPSQLNFPRRFAPPDDNRASGPGPAITALTEAQKEECFSLEFFFKLSENNLEKSTQ